MRTCMASLSAVEWIATVEMPISLQARMTRSAISPRLAMRTFSNMSDDDAEGLAELHRLGVGDANFLHRAGPGRGDGIHGLHRLDDEQRVAFLDRLSHRDEGRFAGFG